MILIKKHFATQIVQDGDVKVANKQNKVMYLSTLSFKFLDIISYISYRTSYDEWVKMYGAKLSKSWFPYKWFDTAEKLDYPGLLPYEEWFCKLKNEMTLSLEKDRACQQIWQEKGCKLLRIGCAL